MIIPRSNMLIWGRIGKSHIPSRSFLSSNSFSLQNGCVFFALLLSLSLLAGCGDNIRATGKVVYSDDKSPLTAGVICFETPTFMARGPLQPDGTFRIGSLKDSDGLPAGTYSVYIMDAIKIIGTDKDGGSIIEPLIDEKITSISTTDLILEVTPSMKYFEIEVERYKPKTGTRR